MAGGMLESLNGVIIMNKSRCINDEIEAFLPQALYAVGVFHLSFGVIRYILV